MCCKQLGHTIDKCLRDPNLKTNANIKAELERLGNLKEFRKLHADTTINTTHFIKKAVMVPFEIDEKGNEKVNETHQEHPFMRGIMNFDDYNYKSFNDYVFLEEPTEVEGKDDKKKRKT
jgi:hypothetical protein